MQTHAGFIIVADSSNHLIRLVNLTSGMVSTLAGQPGLPGWSPDGPPGQSLLDTPCGMAFGPPSGPNPYDIFWTEAGSGIVRRFNWLAVSTVAGMPHGFGSTDGPALGGARFATSGPRGIAFSGSGLLIADTGNHVIRRLDLASGQVSLYAGTMGVSSPFADGAYTYTSATNTSTTSTSSANTTSATTTTTTTTTATSTATATTTLTSATFNTPIGIAVDASGQAYVCDSGNSKIRLLVGGVVFTLAGSTAGMADGTSELAQFNQPQVGFRFAGQLAGPGTGRRWAPPCLMGSWQQGQVPAKPKGVIRDYGAR